MTDIAPIKIKLIAKPQCSICIDSINKVDVCTTLCKHTFHKSCIDTWANQDCPLCRQPTGLATGQPRYTEDETEEAFEARYATELRDHNARIQIQTAQIVANWSAVLCEN